MPHCLRVATKSRKPGLSSIPSRRRGTQKKMRLVCFSIPPDPGARRKPTIFLRGMAEHGEDYEFIVRPAHDCVVIPSAETDLSDTTCATLFWKTLRLSSGYPPFVICLLPKLIRSELMSNSARSTGN